MLGAGAGPTAAQTSTGAIRGAVREADAVVPGVTLVLVNDHTGTARETVSNQTGEYSFGSVPPGAYTIRVALTGFRTYERRNISVAPQQAVIVDVVLEVGELTETVTVTQEVPIVARSSPSIGTVLSAAELNAQPSVARNLYMMSATVPTVITSGNPVFTRLQDLNHPSLVSLGGGARRANSYLIDGVSHTDLVNRPSVNPSLEAISSVNVQVHTYDAEMGRTGGGTYDVVARSGTSAFHGSAFGQVRPNALVANNFFAALAGQPKPDSHFYNSGGGVGGPIARDRTFFWFSMEGYRSLDARNSALRVPTALERVGDFSQSVTASGQPVIIHDPLTTRVDPVTGQLVREPFPGNVIPPERLNAVALNMVRHVPLPTREVSDGAANMDSTADQTGYAVMASLKVDHRLTDSALLSALYITNGTSRTNENFWERGQGPNRFADPRDGTLDRGLHLLAVNNSWVVGNNSVLALRYGYTHLRDDDRTTIAFDPSSLGFDQAYLGAMQVAKFPVGSITDYEGFGAVDPTDRVWSSWSVNGSWSTLVARHTLKMGFDVRHLAVDTQSFSGGAGDLRFDRSYTSADPLSNGTPTSGNAFATFLLGYPSGDPANQSRVTVSSPLNASVRYVGAFVQNDVRVGPALTLNYGLRLEHETGLRERHDRFTVGFDRARDPGGALRDVRVDGRPVQGGLLFAGRDGANTHQGDPPAVKLGPRVGMAYAVGPQATVRAGYGVFWAPWNFQPVSGVNYGQTGFVRQTFIEQGQFVPTTSLNNPFPGGALPPEGAARGALTGVGGQIEFIDQTKGAPWIQQYSFDLSREFRAGMAVAIEYIGATGRSLGLGGSNDGVLNINQLDPAFLALGPALLDDVPNPFHGLPQGEGFAVTSPTVQRRQLLRPFPQFGDILMRQSTLGRSQYHALVAKGERRFSGGWGGRVSYTYSRLTDNQFGETNFMQSTSPEALNVYDLDAEYSRGLLDVPHRVSLTATVELPFGHGRRWATRGVPAALLGGLRVSPILTLESGFPVPLASITNNTGLFTRTQRPVATGTSPATSGGYEARILQGWLSDEAFRVPAAFTLGTAPRTDGRVRGPARNNIDLAITKAVASGRRVGGELRVEAINLTNRVPVVGPIHVVGSAGFGQIRAQSGFMRLVQFSARLTF